MTRGHPSRPLAHRSRKWSAPFQVHLGNRISFSGREELTFQLRFQELSLRSQSRNQGLNHLTNSPESMMNLRAFSGRRVTWLRVIGKTKSLRFSTYGSSAWRRRVLERLTFFSDFPGSKASNRHSYDGHFMAFDSRHRRSGRWISLIVLICEAKASDPETPQMNATQAAWETRPASHR